MSIDYIYGSFSLIFQSDEITTNAIVSTGYYLFKTSPQTLKENQLLVLGKTAFNKETDYITTLVNSRNFQMNFRYKYIKLKA